jgi:hypothetical protein
MEKLTLEQIDLLRRLQTFFKKKMGEWIAGDMFVHENRTGFIESIAGDTIKLHLLWNGLSSGSRVIYKRNWDELLRIPKSIDWQNPERGLWGMVDWKRFYIEEHHGAVDVLNADSDEALCTEADPFTALLKTLCMQEGV